MQKILTNKISELKELCSSFQIQKMYAFGSVLSSKFNDDSDIDFLISFDDTISIEKYTENYFSLYDKLKEIFNRNIDLVTEKSLKNPYLIESINSSKVLIYES